MTPSSADHEEPRVVINDKRRIDPETGNVRTADSSSPFPQAANPSDPGNAGQPLSVQLSDSAEVAAAQQQAAERLADLQRVTAEYANYRKRVDRDRAQVIANAKAQVLTEMLTVLDDIDLAAAHGDLTGAFKAVADRLTSTLQKLGLVQFGHVGDPFDPAHHEAVQFATSSDVHEQTVTAVLRHGYTFGDRTIRAAVVAVTGPDHDGAGSPAEDRSNGSSDSADTAGSGGPGGVSPDGVQQGTDGSNEPARPDEGAPKGDSVPGVTTGDSGGPGNVGPDGAPAPTAS
jgi:molecular chaperone GrpE